MGCARLISDGQGMTPSEHRSVELRRELEGKNIGEIADHIAHPNENNQRAAMAEFARRNTEMLKQTEQAAKSTRCAAWATFVVATLTAIITVLSYWSVHN